MTKDFIVLDKVTVSYHNQVALDDITMTIQKGDFLGIIGGNGSGKTTLLKTILGLISPRSGRVLIQGLPPEKSTLPIAYVPQFSTGQGHFPMTLTEVVTTGLPYPGIRPLRRVRPDQEVFVQNQIAALGLSDLKDRPINALSGGEFQRMLIARALVSQPDLLVLDEPTANVDPAARDMIFQLLKSLSSKMTILLVTHDLDALTSTVTSLACLNRSLIYHGEPRLTPDLLKASLGYAKASPLSQKDPSYV